MNKYLLIEMRDLLEFLVKQARKHDLDEVKIARTRAVELARKCREALKEVKA
jgi:hypothetical protein